MNWIFEDVLGAIRSRRSVRTFRPEALTTADRAVLAEAIRGADCPLGGGRPSIVMADFDIKGAAKPGTYGVIRGASTYLLMAFGDDDWDWIAAGFAMEEVILRATSLGVGSCWIAGTLRASQFDMGRVWPEGQELRIVSPLGYEAGRRSLLERLTRAAVGSNKRKPFGDMFFDGDFSRALSADSPLGQSLEMMRLAPSSTNTQPWRAVVEGSTVHFYVLSKRKLYKVDVGIGLCHFDASERVEGATYGRYWKDASIAPTAPAGMEYVISYKRL